MASTFPGSLTQLGTGGKFVEKQIKAVSGGSFQIKFFEPKALVPPFEIFDAVAKGAIDVGWSASGYWVGKIPAAGFFTAGAFFLGAAPKLSSPWLSAALFGTFFVLSDHLMAAQLSHTNTAPSSAFVASFRALYWR